MELYKLLPSAFGFLYDQCKRDYWLKVKRDLPQPSIPMAQIYKDSEQAVIDRIEAEGLQYVVDQAPVATFVRGETYIRSQSINFPDLKSRCYISGKFDLLCNLVEGGGAVVPDCKMARVKDANVGRYARQLSAYKYCMDHPAPGKFRHDRPIERLGLIVYSPECFDMIEAENERPGALVGGMTWVEIQYDEAAFLSFLHDVVALLDGPMPPPTEDCPWCKYRLDSAVAVTGRPSFEQLDIDFQRTMEHWYGAKTAAILAPPVTEHFSSRREAYEHLSADEYYSWLSSDEAQQLADDEID
jgi:hypothetical protein